MSPKAIQNNHDRSRLFSQTHSGVHSIILGSYIPEAKNQTKTINKATHHASKQATWHYSSLSEILSTTHNPQLKVIFISG